MQLTANESTFKEKCGAARVCDNLKENQRFQLPHPSVLDAPLELLSGWYVH